MFIKTIEEAVPGGRPSSYDYIRIDRGDTYSMDVTLAKIVYPMLRMMQQSKHGVPSAFIPEQHGPQYSFDFIEDNSDAEHDAAHAVWTAMIDKMIFSFKEIAEGKYLGSDFDMKPAARNAYYADIQQGLDLFANHYFSLWT